MQLCDCELLLTLTNSEVVYSIWLRFIDGLENFNILCVLKANVNVWHEAEGVN